MLYKGWMCILCIFLQSPSHAGFSYIQSDLELSIFNIYVICDELSGGV